MKVCLASLLAVAAVAQAGTIKGVVKLKGAPAETTVVYVQEVANLPALVPAAEPPRLSQRGARFSPEVLPVVQNVEVDLTNDDWVTHSAYSKSPAKTFDLGVYAKGAKKLVSFDKPGRVDVFCSIHPAMKGVILVLQNPFFTKPDAHGAFSIENVPPGKYTLKVFREEGAELTSTVAVPEKGDVTVKLEG